MSRRSIRFTIGLLFAALMLLEGLSVGASLWAIQAQQHDALIINLAGRQRMLSQKMVKEAWLSLHTGQAPDYPPPCPGWRRGNGCGCGCRMNYRVLEAANGEEALAVMEEQEEQVAVVLSDVVMPVMGGIRLFHALRERGWEVPVVLLTGHAMDQDLEELQAQGLSAWLTKPPSVEHLAQTIARVLSR